MEFSFEVDDGTIKLDDVLIYCDYWDSMANIVFMSMVDAVLGLKLSANDVQKSRTVGDLINLCKSKLDD